MSNYPAGAANDPNAPYNRREPKMTEFEKSTARYVCDKCSDFAYVDTETGNCAECFEPQEIEEDDGGDDDYDAF